MTNITKASAANTVNVLIRDKCNAGITWGTNNYPANAEPSWFAGPNTGINNTLTEAADTFNGAVTGKSLTDIINYFTGFFAAIRLMRIVIYYNTNGKLSAIYDGTTVANINPSVVSGAMAAGVGDAAPPMLTAGTIVDLSDFEGYCDRMYAKYASKCRAGSAPVTITKTVCHSSCHSSCHTSRGRR